MNSKFKKHVSYKASDLPKFIQEVEEFVRSDQTVIESAFAGTGDYQFVEDFKGFNMGSKWWTLSFVKRTAHFNQFMEACKHSISSEVVVNEANPRIVIREEQKRRGENVVELKCGPGRGCLNFSTHGMCSHTQAAALVWDVEEEYWRFLEISKKVGTSLHSLGKHGLPDGSGKKENQINRGKVKKRK